MTVPVIKQFEHMAKIFPVHTKFADFLDELGMAGWELCAVQRNEFYFKREVTHAITPTITELLDVISKQREAFKDAIELNSEIYGVIPSQLDGHLYLQRAGRQSLIKALALSDKYVEEVC